MKKLLKISILFLSFILTSCSCKTKNLIEEFNHALIIGDKNALVNIYPASVCIDSISFAYNPDLLKIKKVHGKHIVSIGNVLLTVVKDEDGNRIIESSRGLLALDADKLFFARSTGWFNPKITDEANARNLSDEGFFPFVANPFLEGVKKNISVWKNFYAKNYSTFSCKTQLVIKNKNDFDLDGASYSISAKEYGWDIDRSCDVYCGTLHWQGIDVPAHSTGTIYLGTEDIEYTRSLGKITVTFSENADIIKLGYKPTGNEFKEYLSTKEIK